MIIFRILRFLSEEVALSVRGRSNRLGHPRFACARGMYFRRFARRSSDGDSASYGNVSTAWRREMKDIGRSKRKASVADRVARGRHNTNYTTLLYP